MAAVAGVASGLVPGVGLRACVSRVPPLYLATVATGYCPVNAALYEHFGEPPHWRRLRTFTF